MRDRIGIAYRSGGHQIDIRDYNAILDFADKYLNGLPVSRTFDDVPYPPPTQAQIPWTIPDGGGPSSPPPTSSSPSASSASPSASGPAGACTATYAGGYSKMATVWFNALQSVPGSIGNPGSESPSPSATTTASPPPTGTRSGTATYSLVNQWPGGFQASVEVTAGTSAINDWTVTWQYASGQTVTQAWNVTATQTGSQVTARNAGYNGALGAGGSTGFGFLGTWTGANPVPTTLACAAS